MKIHKFAAALLALVLCMSLCLPAALAEEPQQSAQVSGLSVQVKCTGSSIPDEVLTIRLAPRSGAPMPEGKSELVATVDTAACTELNNYTVTVPLNGTFTYTRPGLYEYEVTQSSGSAANGSYDQRTFVLRVMACWAEEENGMDTFYTTAKVYENGHSSSEKQDSILFVNTFSSTSVVLPDLPTLPDLPDPPSGGSTPTPTTPVNPPVADARPVTDTPVVPQAETPVNPPVADARPQLIQTGQLNWPVPMLAAAGAVLMAFGVALQSRRKEDHA